MVTFYLCARGYDVLEAATGRAAIETAISGNPNFILLDLRLPDISGLEVARELRKLPQTDQIPIVAFTGDYGLKPYAKILRHTGIIHCLIKPVSIRELDAAIQRFVPTPTM